MLSPDSKHDDRWAIPAALFPAPQVLMMPKIRIRDRQARFWRRDRHAPAGLSCVEQCVQVIVPRVMGEAVMALAASSVKLTAAKLRRLPLKRLNAAYSAAAMT